MLQEAYLLGRCLGCGAMIPYQQGNIQVKCESCGGIQWVAEFQNEQIRMKLALEEGEQAKQDLEEALRKRDRALDALQEMRDLTETQKKQEVLLQSIEEDISLLRKTFEEKQGAIKSFEGKWERYKLEKLTELYHQAENLQLDMEFDKAEDYYRQVIVSGGKDQEVYWRIILCHYGIVYQDDDEGNKIPSILRPDLTTQLSIRKDLESSFRGETDRKHYSSELKKIDDLLEKYRQCQHAAHYDIFISVKQKSVSVEEKLIRKTASWAVISSSI